MPWFEPWGGRLLRGDRAHAGQAPRRHRHRRGPPQVRQARQGQVREGPGALLRHPEEEHPSVQQLCVPVCLDCEDSLISTLSLYLSGIQCGECSPLIGQYCQHSPLIGPYCQCSHLIG